MKIAQWKMRQSVKMISVMNMKAILLNATVLYQTSDHHLWTARSARLWSRIQEEAPRFIGYLSQAQPFHLCQDVKQINIRIKFYQAESGW